MRNLCWFILAAIIFVIIMFFYFKLENEKISLKNCNQPILIMFSKTIHCDDNKQYVHVSKIGDSVKVMCCEKE